MENSSNFIVDPHIDNLGWNTLREKLSRSVRLRDTNWRSKELQHRTRSTPSATTRFRPTSSAASYRSTSSVLHRHAQHNQYEEWSPDQMEAASDASAFGVGAGGHGGAPGEGAAGLDLLWSEMSRSCRSSRRVVNVRTLRPSGC
jgi:hypothetical protein